MKKIISFMLILAMIIGVIPSSVGQVFAAETNNDGIIQVKSAYEQPGDTVEVKITITDNPGILGMTLKVTYDDSKMSLTSVKNGEAFSYMTFTTPKDLSSGCKLPWAAEVIEEEDIKDGVIATLSFKVDEGVEPEETLGISISYEKGAVIDNDLNPLYPEIVNGYIRVIDYEPGDLNEDTFINTTDVVYLMRYIAGGYNVSIDERAADVNDDGSINTTDVVYIMRNIAGGYGVELKPSTPKCSHTMEATEAKAATCTQNGNEAYWYCTKCEKYFSNEAGTVETSKEETVIEATGHGYATEWSYDPSYHWHAASCEHSELVSDRGEHNFGSDRACTVCGMSNAPDPSKPYMITYKLVEYNKQNGDTYLETLNIDNSKNKTWFSATDSFELADPSCGEAYTFNGWYTENGTKVTKISAGTKEDITLYARWTERTFTITYNVYNTPVGAITDETKKSYKPSQGLAELPKPDLNNYIWQGWFSEDGTEVNSIPIGTTGNIVLIPHLTNERNLAIPKKDSQPLVLEDTKNGVILFAYELGTIKNVPLTDAIWEIQSVAGLEQQQSKTYTSEIVQEQAIQITDMISDTTVDSSTWTLSENWTDTIEVNEEWAKENATDVEKAKEQMLTDSNTLSLTNSTGVVNTTSHTNGTTTKTEGAIDLGRETGSHFDVNVDADFSLNLERIKGFSAGLKIPFGGGTEANLGADNEKKKGFGFELGLGAEYGNYDKNTTNIHVGTEKTTVDTTVNGSTASWNSSETSSRTQEISQNESIREALKEVISTTKGYGKTYSSGGEGSSTQGTSVTESSSTTTSSTLVYKTTVMEETYQMQKADGKIEGKYRLVIAGDIHVFAMVGYDVATKSYFTYTYNILDDDTYSFLDYTPKGGDYGVDVYDYENSVLPFEIPFFVHEYVASKIVVTEGLGYEVDSTTGTAKVTSFGENVGTEENPEWKYPESMDVIVPSYISSGGTAYRVTELDATAFAGAPIRSIVLSDYITDIPANAFKDCTKLEQISGRFTTIGDYAFSGCVELENFIISPAVSYIGEKAFENVPNVTMTALNEEYALSAAAAAHPEITDTDVSKLREKLAPYAKDISKNVIESVAKSGAKNVTLDISTISKDSTILKDVELTIEVPQIESFELIGDKDTTYTDLKVRSNARVTKMSKLVVGSSEGVPLEIMNGDLVLDTVNITAQNFVLLLAQDGASISLIRDSRFTSQSGNAVVAKNTIIKSVVDEENVRGTLKVYGDFYYCGTKPSANTVTINSGEWKELTETEFLSYIQGCFKITFDPNGGSVDKTEMTAFVGQAIGALPVPSRTGYNFVGWVDKNGATVTAESKYTTVNDVYLRAQWSPMAYRVNWNTGAGYSIIVERTSSPYVNAPTGVLSNGATVYYGDVLSITYTANTGYTINSKGSTSITVTGNVTSANIYATASVNSYTATWSTGTGYTITVNRTSSPYAGASIGYIGSGTTVYYGDVLSVTYTASTGYRITSNGSTSITVTRNITSADIYANATLNSYTYTIVYRSSNDTLLGTSSATYNYGTTNTIYPPEIPGYYTPASQIVAWHSTDAEVITFIYYPIEVATSQYLWNGWWWWSGTSDYGVCYDVHAEYQNRTADSVQIRLVWKQAINKAQYGFTQQFYASFWHNGTQRANTGDVTIATASLWPQNGSWHTGSTTAYSNWITVSLDTTNATTVVVNCDWWSSADRGSWADKILSIPAY